MKKCLLMSTEPIKDIILRRDLVDAREMFSVLALPSLLPSVRCLLHTRSYLCFFKLNIKLVWVFLQYF